MNFVRVAAVACFAALAVPASFALGSEPAFPVPTGVSSSADAPGVSSSNDGAALPAPSPATGSFTGGDVLKTGARPFSAIAVGIKVGVAGIGAEVATPLANKFNLRGSASFISVSPAITADSIQVNGTIDFRTVNASLDFYPLGGSFRISPGVTLYNGNKLDATANVAGGQSFTLNNVNYTSSVTVPVTGTFDMAFGNKVAPSITIGFGNMLPRKANKHWSVPVELGMEYIGAPKITLNLTGSTCQGTPQVCTPIATNPTTQANIAAQQTILNNDVSDLRFYPILSVGLAYKFNLGGK